MPDPWDKYATPIGGAASVAPASTPTASSDPWDKYASPAGGSSLQIPNNGNPTPATPSGSEDDPWYKKVWDFANTPLTEQFGIPSERQGAGGFERAGEHILAGLTSPLSLALTAATFGTGGFIESAGASALKEAGEAAGLGAEEIAANLTNAEKAAKVAIETKNSLPSVPLKEALEGGGHDLGLVNRAKNELGPIDLSNRFDEEKIQEALSEKGFSGEEIKSLGKASEAIRAAEAGPTSAEAAGQLGPFRPRFAPIDDAVRAAGLDVDKWKQAQDLLRANNLTEEDLIGGNLLERGAFQILRKTLPTLPIASTVKIAKTAQTVLNAGFTFQQFETAAAMSPRFIDALKEGDTDKAIEYGTEAAVSGLFGAAGAGHFLHSAGELFDPLTEPTSKLRPSDQVLAYNRAHGELLGNHQEAQDNANALAKQAYDIIGHKPEGKVVKDSPEIKAQKELELATALHYVVTGGDPTAAAQAYNAWAEAAGREDRLPVMDTRGGPLRIERPRGQDPTPITSRIAGLPEPRGFLPDNVDDQIKNNNFKDTPKEYQDLMLDSMKRVAQGDLTDKEQALANFLRNGEAQNFEIGSNNGLLQEQVDNYMKRRYKDTNEEGKVISAQTKAGKFDTSVSGNRQRVYESHVSAVLKSPKELDMNPIDLVSDNRAEILKAAANKKFLADIIDRDLRDSTGRPILVQSSAGNVVHGQDGEDPSTFISPDRINLRKLNISDPSVQRMKSNGMLDRFLETKDIKDITPHVYPDTLNSTIAKLQEHISGLTAPHRIAELQEQLNTLQEAQKLSGQDRADALRAYNEKMKPLYVWNPKDYVSVDHSAMRGWNFVTNDTAGNRIMVDSDIKASPEFAQDLKNRLGLEKSKLQEHPLPAALLKANTKLKGVLLNLSPFHLAQEALRAVMIGVNPFSTARPDLLTGERVDPSDPNSPTLLKEGVKQGLTTGTDGKALQGSSEGVASGGLGVLRKAGPIGRTVADSMDWYHDFLFKRVIPSYKARAFEKLFRNYQEKYPDWTTDRVAKVTADHVNNAFGGINWKALGRSATTQDWGRIMFLAPDWLESEMRSMGQLFNKEQGGISRTQITKMAMGLWGLARVANLANTGNAHFEAPFGLAVQNKDGKDIIFSMRTLPTDVLHAASDPVGFIRGRISPTLSMGTEIATGRDRLGRKLGPQDMWADVLRNMAPIPLQDVGQAISGTGPQVGNAGQIANAIGATAQVYQTPAQKLASELASNHSEDGPIDPAMMARHRRIMDFEDAARRGDMPMADLMRLTYQTDQLHENELKKIQLNLKQTQGMSSDMASLYSRAARLPAKEYLQLLDVASPREKVALIPLTLQTQKKYLTKAKKDMTPAEREKDPVFQRFVNMTMQTPEAPQ